MKKMSEEEAKKNLITMFSFFNNLCRNNNIKYSLIGGSLIGAVRHNGMIPWDDDIDICFEIDEYNKFLDLIKGNNYSFENGRYLFMCNSNNSSYYYPYIKMIDTSTSLCENNVKKIDNYGQFLDIFYYNNVSEKKIVQNIHWVKILFGKILVSGYATTEINQKDKYKYFKFAGKIIAHIFKIKNILKLYDKNVRKCKKGTSYCLSNWPCYKKNKEIQKTTSFKEYIDSDFDGVNAMIIKDYDTVLKTTFGDYMTLPPIDKRINHKLTIYKK